MGTVVDGVPEHLAISLWLCSPWNLHFASFSTFYKEKSSSQINDQFIFSLIQVKKYFELEPLARGKRWILQPCSLDDMDSLKDSFSQLISLLEEKDHEAGRMWNVAQRTGSPKGIEPVMFISHLNFYFSSQTLVASISVLL